MSISLFVKCSDGKTIRLDISRDQTVWDLMVAINSKNPDTKPQSTYLLYQGRRLQEDNKLSYYGLGNDTTLLALKRACGD
jgi:hypothetical protein